MSEHKAVVRTLTGRVVSNKMNKTITVQVDRRVKHEAYGKYISRRTKLFAHERGAISECAQFSFGHLPWKGRHAAIRAGVHLVRIDVFQRAFDCGRDRFGRFDIVRGDIDCAHHDGLILEQSDELQWHF